MLFGLCNGYLKPLFHQSLSQNKYLSRSVLTLFQTTDFKLKQSADDNFKFDENVRKFAKWVGNTVSKGEISRYEQFLLFPQCFQKVCFPGASKGVTVWEWVNPLPDDKTLDLSKWKQIADDILKCI